MSDEHRFQHYAFYRGVNVKADGCGTFFAVVHGHPILRNNYGELCALIDRKIALAAQTPQEDA